MSSHLCGPATDAAGFLLVKSQYRTATARLVERGALFLQVRQAFPPGEVTAEEANKTGYETAMRWTKGKFQFFVCTHTSKGHIHNHIYYNSTGFDCSRKFHNFTGFSFSLRRLSDRVWLEHDLSVIQNPQQHSKGRFLHELFALFDLITLGPHLRKKIIIVPAVRNHPVNGLAQLLLIGAVKLDVRVNMVLSRGNLRFFKLYDTIRFNGRNRIRPDLEAAEHCLHKKETRLFTIRQYVCLLSVDLSDILLTIMQGRRSEYV